MSNDKTFKPIRLNKYIAESGVASRRKADELIESGKVKVNGRTQKKMGTVITPGIDEVTVSGEKLKGAGKKYYYMFNKPIQVVTSMNDPEGRTSVADYFASAEGRLFPVGRLDWDSEGLLLMTNDGEFAQAVTHPKEEIPKTYLVKLDGQPTEPQLRKLVTGVSIEGGRATAKYVERIKRGSEKYAWIKIVITEGRNRQIRRMFESIGYSVTKLQRVAIGFLKLGKLRKGMYVKLKAVDLAKIFDGRSPNLSDAKGLYSRDTLEKVQKQRTSHTSGSTRRTKKVGNKKRSAKKREATSESKETPSREFRKFAKKAKFKSTKGQQRGAASKSSSGPSRPQKKASQGGSFKRGRSR
ncbi:MAG: rRNA pseudouridine synthase [Bdellovibrionales bacterium]|nr:rRNA pseudouridine synthase [Bdellovibrionales bacterium]